MTIAPSNVRIIAPYTPLPWQIAPWRDRSPSLLCTGSAGGGKSRFAAEKLHAYCLRYPGAMALAIRKTRASMTKGTVLFLRRTVIGPDPQVQHLESKDYFAYRNGSILAYAGLEDEQARERLKSIGHAGAVDIAWLEEATEFDESDYNAVDARMRGRAAPWRQVLLTTNPGGPLHWIKRRLIDAGEATVYTSTTADNPHNPDDYADRLDRLTGIDALRLRGGLWVQAEGVIFDTWRDDGAGNVTDAADYVPDGGDLYWFVDDGYSAGAAPHSAGIDPQTGMYVADAHPRVILLAQLRHDGQLCLFHEDYACLTLSDRHLSRVKALDYPEPERVIYGPGAAEIRGRIRALDLSARQSGPRVAESIKELRRAFAPDANGRRQVLVHPRCVHLRRELNTYAYEPGSDEKPIKAFDHGPDALRVGYWALRREL